MVYYYLQVQIIVKQLQINAFPMSKYNFNIFYIVIRL